jgi:adenylate cyclase
MEKKTWRVSIQSELVLWFLLLLILPALVLGLLFRAQVPLAFMLTLLALFAVFGCLMVWLLRRRVLVPLQQFRENLEDISEGFIIEEIPHDTFSKAEQGITDCFHKVIQINKMLLKNVDNLERGFEEERLAKLQQLQLTQAYERFVPKEFLSHLNRGSITEVQLGDHVKTKMTLLFSDMRAFTTMSESITPEENFKFLTSYLVRMEPIVRKHQGFIDKYIGDAIMALFSGSADQALQAAIEMLQELLAYNAERAERGEQAVAIGIGLNTGPMMLGILGGEHRMEGTVISDAVNLASRVEDLNKLYGTSLLISENTYLELEDKSRYHIRVIDRVTVKGKQERVLMYEVFDADPEELREAKRATSERLDEAATLFHAGEIEQAEGLFRVLLQESPNDTVVQLYLKRCAPFITYTEREGAQQ